MVDHPGHTLKLTVVLAALLPMAAAADDARANAVERYRGGAEGFFEPLGPPRPGEWLAVVKESGQTAEAYARDLRNRRTARRRALVLAPMGAVAPADAELLEKTRRFAEAFFLGCDVRLVPRMEVPVGARHGVRAQLDGEVILAHLAARVPADALALAAIVPAEDLFAGDMNFVFGLGSEAKRAGVYSLYRYAEPARRLRRTLGTMTHELGHILGMDHCVYFNCLMNGSNSLAEGDTRPLFLCPVCAEKLALNLGFDRGARLEAIRAAFDALGMPEEAAFAARLLARRTPSATSRRR